MCCEVYSIDLHKFNRIIQQKKERKCNQLEIKERPIRNQRKKILRRVEGSCSYSNIEWKAEGNNTVLIGGQGTEYLQQSKSFENHYEIEPSKIILKI